MTAKRQYRLQCPIARALDAVGDRWALLILRDLHAGPARFHELEEGLGVATNLLTSRLSELTDAGLVRPSASDGPRGYELTDLGRRTDRVLWELTRFGGLLDRETDPREPGNLRTLALPLRVMLESVDDRPDLVVGLVVDGDEFTIESSPAAVSVEHGRSPAHADLALRTSYQAFLDVSEGQMTLDDFVTGHVEIVDGAEHAPTFLALMAAAMAGID